AAGRMKSHAREPVRERRAACRIDGKLQKLETGVRGRLRRLEQLRPGHTGALFLEEQERAIAIERGRAVRRSAKAVVEDFERERSRIARRQHLAREAGHIEIALPWKAAVMTAPFQHVHRELRRI